MAVTDLDRGAIVRGAGIAMVLAVPIALVGNALDLDSDSNLIFVFLGLILVAFGLGGFVAARGIDETPLTHGAVAALVGYVVVQVAAIIRRLVIDEDVRWVGVVFNGLLAASAGLLGALWSARRNRT